MTEPRYAYLHGFASGPQSRKGTALAAAFAERGLALHLPDLNVPSFPELTYRGMLEGVDRLDREHGARGEWRFVGSSMGGWVAARWAELHPERAGRLLLLAPGFDLPNRWRELITPDELLAWQRRGWIETEDGAGRTVRLGWDLMEDAERQPPWPEPRCPIWIVHGRRDETVPYAVSRRYARSRAWIRLEPVDDDHSLEQSLPVIRRRALEWLAAP